VWLVSRGRPASLDANDGVTRIWIQADLVADSAAGIVAEAMAGARLDVVIYNAGIWETHAFEPDYDFTTVSERETRDILAVNLTSAITCLQHLTPNLRQSPTGKIILIGSTSGLENIGAPEVAYTASKFGLRGVAHALRESVRRDRIAVTCLNLGNLAGEIPYAAGVEAALNAYNSARIPVQDVVAVVKCLMGLSRATCVKEVDMPAMLDTGV
jgi:short-subunit dehydrogenase